MRPWESVPAPTTGTGSSLRAARVLAVEAVPGPVRSQGCQGRPFLEKERRWPGLSSGTCPIGVRLLSDSTKKRVRQRAVRHGRGLGGPGDLSGARRHERLSERPFLPGTRAAARGADSGPDMAGDSRAGREYPFSAWHKPSYVTLGQPVLDVPLNTEESCTSLDNEPGPLVSSFPISSTAILLSVYIMLTVLVSDNFVFLKPDAPLFIRRVSRCSRGHLSAWSSSSDFIEHLLFFLPLLIVIVSMFVAIQRTLDLRG